MANMNNKKRTEIMRVDEEFRKIVMEALKKQASRNPNIRVPRITKAMARQYMKYPLIRKELEDSRLDDN